MKRLLAGLALLLAAGCATDTALDQGRRLMDQGAMEAGLRRLEEGHRADPQSVELRNYYLRYRDLYVDQLLYEGDKARLLGRSAQALAAYGRALEFSPESARAQAGLDASRAAQRQREAVREAQALLDAGNAEAALRMAQDVLRENPAERAAQALQRRIEEAQARVGVEEPQLRAAYRKPVTLELRDAPLKNAFDVLALAAGINFVFDRDVRADLRTTILVRDTPFEEALNFLLVTNQLEKKVLNGNTLLVYPNLPGKARDYQELVTRTFYLGNASAKQMLNLVKTVLKTRDVFIDERLNLLVMRDTPKAIRLAERLIAAQDLAEPEVILEMKVLEITRSKLQNLGVNFPAQVSLGLQGAAGVPGQATLDEWLSRRSASLAILNVTDPAFILNLQRQDGDTNLLASPRIRVRNREKAKIHIGDRLPVITTTSTANVGVAESVQYLDIGLKLDIEPNVHLDEEVAMKVGLEVSNIVQQIQSRQGTLTYRIGTRNTATVLRVANGETQVLAGLIQDEDRRTADKVPGLADLPLLGRLFTNKNDSRTKTEIVLLITPYVVRNIDRPAPSALELPSGTEAGFGAAPLALPSAPDASPPLAAAQSPARARSEGAGALLLSAPAQVKPGSEFTVSIGMPPNTPGSVRVDLVYDGARLQALDAPGTPGRIQVTLPGAGAVRFRALEGQAGAAQVSVDGILPATGSAADAPRVIAPAPVTINVAP